MDLEDLPTTRPTTSPTTSRTTPATSPGHVLVVGGTGRSGRRVAAQLRARGVRTAVTSRRGAPPFDRHRPSSWEAALSRTRAAYLCFAPDLAMPGAPPALEGVARTAARLGVERLVLLSGRGEPEAEASELAVRRAGLPTVVLRSAFFAQDFSEHFLHGPVLDGVVAMPAGGVAEPFVDLDDVAEVAAQLLLVDDPDDETYELTGPEGVTFAQAAEILGRVVGWPVRYQPVTVEQFVAGAVAAGADEAEIGVLGHVFGQVLDGRNSTVVPDLPRLLGRPARTLAQALTRAAEQGAWDDSGRSS